VITFSDMCVDLIITGNDVIPQFGQVEKLVQDYTLELGGSCNIFACQAAKMGLRTAGMGRVGNDIFGQLILRRLHDCNVDTRLVEIDPSLKTGVGIALCPPGDRAILTYIGTINAVFSSDITDEILKLTHHIHHASHFLHTNLQPDIADIFQRAHNFHVTTSLDPNWDPEGIWDGDLARILPHTDIFLPNEQEAIHISHKETVSQAAQYFLQKGVKSVVVKSGAKGAFAFIHGEDFFCPVDPVSGGDSIGAGDSFDAGFIAAWFRNHSLKDCLEYGNFCGRSVAAKIGGLTGQPYWNEMLFR